MPKEKVIRFAVRARDGRSSSAWRVWSSANKSDVYFAHRTLAGEMKGSLHQSGSWQYGLTEQRAQLGKPIPGWASDSRHIMIWPRPQELFPGITRAVSLGFLTSELQHLPGEDLAKCHIIPAAPDGKAVEITLFLVSAGAVMGGNWPGEKDMATSLVGELVLPSGETLYVVHREFDPPEVTLKDLTDHRQRFAHLEDYGDVRARFAILGVNPVDESRFIIEGAVHPEAVSCDMS